MQPKSQFWDVVLLTIHFVLFLACVAVLIIIVAVAPARAHDAPSGWSYPFACCSTMDCREVPASTVKEDGRGGYIVPSGEQIIRADVRIKNSPDGAYHWCTVAGEDDGRTICLFVPPPAY